MKNIGFATAIAGALTAGIIGLAAPATASTGTSPTQDTVASLEAQGFKVFVNNQTGKPLAETQVVNVREGNDVTGWRWDISHEHLTKKVLYTNVYVDVR